MISPYIGLETVIVVIRWVISARPVSIEIERVIVPMVRVIDNNVEG